MAKLDDLVRDVATLYRTEAEDASSAFTYEQFSLLAQVINMLKLALETNVKRNPVCTCQNCAVCGGEHVICGECGMCTCCHLHKIGCKGCPGSHGGDPESFTGDAVDELS